MPTAEPESRSSTSSLASLPPFPSDIPTAPLTQISLAQLQIHDAEESRRAVDACKTRGFFYLNLRGTREGEELEAESEELFDIAKHVFDLDEDEKVKCVQKTGSTLAGYKPAGTTTTAKGKPDTTEFFNVSKDHIHALCSAPWEYPAPISTNMPLFKSFSMHAYAVGMTILECLAIQLGLEQTAFTAFSDFNQAAGDHVRLTKKTPHEDDDGARIGLTAHTDFGSITILFNHLGGLQIKSKSPATLGQWEYVRPLPGHAIINLGDAMVKFTSGELKSARHRVVPAPGKQAQSDRYSIVYFVRPNDEVRLKAVYGENVGKEEEGGGVRAKEWIARRFNELQSELKGRGNEVR